MNEPIDVEGGRVTSTSETPEQIKEAISGKAPEKPEPKPEISEAAAKLGSEGGKALAQKRAEASKDAPGSKRADPDDQSDEEAIREAEAAEKEGKLGKPRHDPRAKMLQKAREAAELKRERERLKAEIDRRDQELAALRAKPAETKPAAEAKPKEAPAEVDPKPKKDDFADWDEYIEAMSEWKARRVLEKDREEQSKGQAEAKQAQDINTGMRTWAERMEKASEGDPSYREKILGKINWFRPSWARGESPLESIHVVSDEVVRAENAPEIMLHFAEHPEEVQRLAALRNPDGSADWRSVQVEMRVLSRTLGAATTPTAPKPAVSQASDPVKSVTGPPHLADKAPDPNDNSPEGYARHKAYWSKPRSGAISR